MRGNRATCNKNRFEFHDIITCSSSISSCHGKRRCRSPQKWQRKRFIQPRLSPSRFRVHGYWRRRPTSAPRCCGFEGGGCQRRSALVAPRVEELQHSHGVVSQHSSRRVVGARRASSAPAHRQQTRNTPSTAAQLDNLIRDAIRRSRPKAASPQQLLEV